MPMCVDVGVGVGVDVDVGVGVWKQAARGPYMWR